MGRKLKGVRAISQSSIEIDFYYQGVRCRERIILEPTPANLKRAKRHREAILDSISKGTFDYAVTFPNSQRAQQFARQPGANLTIEDYLSSWLEMKEPGLKASTLRDYRKIINHQIIPEFGNLYLIELRRPHIRQWLSAMDCSEKRIANIISPLRAALQDAVDDELIDHNPLAGWRFKKLAAPPKDDKVDPFNRDEQSAILDALDGQKRNLIQFAFWSGLRTSELVALEWGDIDFIRGVVYVSRAITQAAREAETTKTRSGTRPVKLLARARDALESQKAFTFLHSERVFHNPRTEEPWTGDQAIRKTLWIPALKKAGVRYRNPYQTRHTYGSMMLSAGEPLAWVSHQMGHSSVIVTAKIYARWIPEADPLAGSKAEEMFGANADQNADQTVTKADQNRPNTQKKKPATY